MDSFKVFRPLQGHRGWKVHFILLLYPLRINEGVRGCKVHHWLPITAIFLIFDNRGFEVLGTFVGFTLYGWMEMSEIGMCIIG